MKTQKQIVETYLPIFPGFYNSLIDSENEIEYYLEIENLEYDKINFDFKEWQKDCSFYACKFIESELKDLGVLSVEFQELISPQFYNYGTDSVNCKIEIEPKKLAKYLKLNFTEFEKYLNEKYTSRSGFISHYSNHAIDWLNYTSNFSDFSKNAHYLGAILTFICENEGIDESDMSWYILDYVCVHHYIDILEPQNDYTNEKI